MALPAKCLRIVVVPLPSLHTPDSNLPQRVLRESESGDEQSGEILGCRVKSEVVVNGKSGAKETAVLAGKMDVERTDDGIAEAILWAE